MSVLVCANFHRIELMIYAIFIKFAQALFGLEHSSGNTPFCTESMDQNIVFRPQQKLNLNKIVFVFDQF